MRGISVRTKKKLKLTLTKEPTREAFLKNIYFENRNFRPNIENIL